MKTCGPNTVLMDVKPGWGLAWGTLMPSVLGLTSRDALVGDLVSGDVGCCVSEQAAMAAAAESRRSLRMMSSVEVGAERLSDAPKWRAGGMIEQAIARSSRACSPR